MTKLDQVKCDKCGKTANNIENNDTFTFLFKYTKPPKGWVCLASGKDLCPKCYKKYKQILKKFMSE